ncbi:protein brambleberry-like [Mytilus edulis]|uniref:protein brambleberry-like n=1 Tax=Mytilus edulis TaxID=6550 RepID=UPI0039EDE910
MHHICYSFFILLVCFTLTDSLVLDSIKGWLFGPDTDIDKSFSKNVKFEVVSTDKKFLKFASELNEMSPLDSCYHIVVFSLKKRCGELTEEELNKLAVQLLNCQSQAEGRPVFKCTTDMTLADCTREMDGPTWNAYQIVGNRARAMCYATQQEQFRRMTEKTVSNLVTAATDQLDSMELIKNNQEALHNMATDTIRKLYESQQEMLGHHQQLQITQEGVMTQITDNMASLKTEKALIAAGNKELADQTHNIKNKLEEAMQTLQSQNQEQKTNHEIIIQDLMSIQTKAQDTIDKLDKSTQHLLQNHQDLKKQYVVMHEKMVKINSTVTDLMKSINSMQEKLDKKISWFSHLLGTTEEKITTLLVFGQHIVFLILIMFLTAYLQVPPMSRVLILIVTFVNSAIEIQSGKGAGFIRMAGVDFSIIMANGLYYIWKSKSNIQKAPLRLTGTDTDATQPVTNEELQNLTNIVGRLQFSLNESGIGNDTSMRTTPNVTQIETQARPDSSTMPEDVDRVHRYVLNSSMERFSTHSREGTPVLSRTSTPQPSTSINYRNVRGSTPSSSMSSRCNGLTRGGTPCRLSSVRGQSYCRNHTDQG